MLTRLKVNGFKNLVDVDVRFGPFTCIAGPNAVGKSNLFDAIRFLSALATQSIMKAAVTVRNERTSNTDVGDLFHRVGRMTARKMSFEVEMIVPTVAVDDLGQTGQAKANFLQYTLELQYRKSTSRGTTTSEPLEIVKEELRHIKRKDWEKSLLFPNHSGKWRESALKISHRTAPYISTKEENDQRVITLHQDGGQGRGLRALAGTQPRTILSTANASESPTALCARREMESWQLLQLEPSALRESDNINAPFHLTPNGSHLPATLYHLNQLAAAGGKEGHDVYAQLANRLAELVDDVTCIEVDYNKVRESLTLLATGKDGASHPARGLSDGTLRFLALAVLELDPTARGVICLEEPENGIHPERIPAMMRLLQDIAVDPQEAIDDTNPLRQVIVNTHSPALVLEAPDDALLVAESRTAMMSGTAYKKTVFSHLPETWRCKTDYGDRTVPKGKLLAYLNPVSPARDGLDTFYARHGRKVLETNKKLRPRVADRNDLRAFQPSLLNVAEPKE